MALMPLATTQAAAQTMPQEVGAFDFLQSTPLGLALMQAGLSIGGGTPAGQAFGQGLGTYQQLMASKAAGAAAQQKAKMDAAEFGLKAAKAGEFDKELAFKEKKLASEEKRAAAKLKADADKVKAMAGAKAPQGVDDKLWNQALDTATLASEDMTVDPGEVYKIYNTMVPEGKQVYMPMSSQDATGILGLIEQNPDYADQYLEAASSRYGVKGATRLNAAWQKKQAALAKKAADEEAAAASKQMKNEEAAMKFPTEFKRPVLNAAPVATPDIYKAMYPNNGAGNPWAGVDPTILKALTGQ